jgi:hypothetical protein
MMTPGIAGYLSVKSSGKHGSLRAENAVGRSWSGQLWQNLDVIQRTYMNKSSSNKYTSTEVFAEEKDLGRYLQRFDFLGYNWKATTQDTGRKHND